MGRIDHRIHHARQISAKRAFTLVELLVVIAVIAILASIIFAVGGGIAERQRADRVRGEMQTIALGLEKFKDRYKDYPWLGNDDADARNAPDLYRSLVGELALKIEVTGSTRTISMEAVGGTTPQPFITLEAFTVDDSGAAPVFVDPWGNPYYYFYKSPGNGLTQSEAWRRGGFVLLSAGPDGLITAGVHNNGDLPTDPDAYFTGENADNIVYGLEN